MSFGKWFKSRSESFRKLGWLATMFSISAAVATALFTCNANRYDELHRALELTTQFGAQWEMILDTRTRGALRSTINAFTDSTATPAEQHQLLDILVTSSAKSDAELRQVQSRLLTKWFGNVAAPDTTVQRSWVQGRKGKLGRWITKRVVGANTTGMIDLPIRDYRLALVRALNLFEQVAVLRNSARRNGFDEEVRIIDSQYWKVVLLRVDQLRPFIDAYSLHTYGVPRRAWTLLLDEIDQGPKEATAHSETQGWLGLPRLFADRNWEAIVKVAAILIGGLFTYYRFIRGRVFATRLTPGIVGKIVNTEAGRLVKFTVTVANTGNAKVPLNLDKTFVEVKTLDAQKKYSVVTWGLRQRVPVFANDERWIESGETATWGDVVAISDDVEAVCLQFAVTCTRPLLRSEGNSWVIQTVATLTKEDDNG